MRHLINGRVYDVPTDSNGRIDSDDMRRLAGVSPDRPLVLMESDGANTVINPGEKMMINPGHHFQEMPLHRRG